MATPQTTVTKPTETPKAPVDPIKAALPVFTVAERLAQHGKAEDLRESEVSDLLMDGLFPEPMTSTWVNTEEPGRFHHVVNTLGWHPIRVEWLKAGTMSGAWAKSNEGYVTRGEKGADIACLMPTRFFLERQRKMAEARSLKARDVSSLKTRTAEALAAQGDHRGADRAVGAQMSVTAFSETKGAMPGLSGEDRGLNSAEE